MIKVALALGLFAWSLAYSLRRLKRKGYIALTLPLFLLLALLQPLRLGFRLYPPLFDTLTLLGFGGLAYLYTRDQGVSPIILTAWALALLRTIAAAVNAEGWLPDFSGLYLATLKVRHGLGDTLYDFYLVKGHFGALAAAAPRFLQGMLVFDKPIPHFTGHPAAPLIFLWLSAFNQPQAARLYAVLSSLLIASVSLGFYRKFRGTPWAIMSLWMGISPTLERIILVSGNTSVIAAGLLGLSLLIPRPSLQGLLLALAALIKPYLWPLLLLLGTTKPKSRWLWAWGAVAGATTLALALFGAGIFKSWFILARAASSTQWTAHWSFSPLSLIYQLGYPRWAGLTLQGVVILIFAVPLFAYGVRSKMWEEKVGLWTLASMYLPSVVWPDHLALPLVALWGVVQKYPAEAILLGIINLRLNKVAQLAGFGEALQHSLFALGVPLLFAGRLIKALRSNL